MSAREETALRKKMSMKANAYPWILLQECVRYRPGTRRHINRVGGLMDKDKKKEIHADQTQ